MGFQLDAKPTGCVYRRIFRNRTWVLLWSGKAVSTVGDVFFNLAVMWVVYTVSGSALQTAIIQVIWQASSVLFGPLAGSWADLWDRKRIMVLTNVLAAVVVGAVAIMIQVQGQVSLWGVFVAVFLLNSLNTFLWPATFSVLPEIVEKDLLVTSSGLFSVVQGVAGFIGSTLAGIVIALVGVVGVVIADALSFLFAALSIGMAPLPARTTAACEKKRVSSWRAFLDGWQVLKGQRVIRTLIGLSACANVIAFIGPLMPALVHLRLHSGAVAYGLLSGAGIIGGVAGGVLASGFERRIGAGRLLAASSCVEGLCILGQAASTSFPVTAGLEVVLAFCSTLANIVSIALLQALVPENYRGRVFATASAMAVMIIPLSALAGGWLADLFGPAPLFAFGGVWIFGTAVLTWASRQIRTVRLYKEEK